MEKKTHILVRVRKRSYYNDTIGQVCSWVGRPIKNSLGLDVWLCKLFDITRPYSIVERGTGIIMFRGTANECLKEFVDWAITADPTKIHKYFADQKRSIRGLRIGDVFKWDTRLYGKQD